ncbi:hypothetical protein DENSPDRAFT_835170 [Dentipellis sp. KUC8613]|nr:hypothetical protein DENSPDRAFT_835170 [Dentipellis sp. KUC8613]
MSSSSASKYDLSSQPKPRTEYDHLRESTTASDDADETSSLPPLPEIPPAELDLTISLDSILGATSVSSEKVQKRASNVLKLAEENEKLKQELRAMSERLEAAERRRAELDKRRREADGDNAGSAR